MDDAKVSKNPDGVPTWDEGIARLLAKLPGLIGDGAITRNDARVVEYLVSRPPAVRTARCPVCVAPSELCGLFHAPSDEELFAAVANHVMQVHGGGPVDAFNAAEHAVLWVGLAYRKDARERPWLYQPEGSRG